MKRRDFIKKSAITASLPFWLQSCQLSSWRNEFPIFVHSDYQSGHLAIKGKDWPKVPAISTETLIVGGGMAGLSAAYQLRDQDTLLLEVSDRFGGTSAAKSHEQISFAQGAHYDLAYPEYYGQEVLQILEELNIIQYESWHKAWNFVDKQHLIPYARRQTCYDHGKRRTEVIEDRFLRHQFHQIMDEYEGKMPLPTRLISEELHHLNDITFHDFLKDKMDITPAFKRQVSYHMMDDYGGNMNQVSALAGIHYFKCRPYQSQPMDLLSPSQGNDYFVQKILAELSPAKVKHSHLVHRIEKTGEGFTVHALDTLNQHSLTINCDQLIYAGQKHALRYIHPADYPLFEQNEQAPWMVINFITKAKHGNYGFWQNEFLGDNEQFLGFIDSSAQSREDLNGKRILTAYYCLKPEDRNYLTTIDKNKKRIVTETLEKIELMLEESLEIESAHINVMGHAMPIPKPGFLFNTPKSNSGIRHAGVDYGRLPLLFEAMDSGIVAAQG